MMRPGLFFPLLALLGFLAAQTNGLPREFQFRLRTPEADTTVLFKGLDLVLVADKAGNLASPLDPGKTSFPLTNGNYAVDVVIRGRSSSQILQIDERSGELVWIEPVASGRGAERTRTLEAVEVAAGGRVDDLSRSVMTAAEARSIPGTGGDILRGLMNFPGVAPTGSFGSDLYIRGGDRADLLYTYDGVRIGNPFHILGFYSVFPSSSLESVNFYPGAFPSRFGNSQGAVIELMSRTSYDKGRLKGELDGNLAVAGGYLSIPLGPYFQLSFGGRRTYYEFYLGIIKALPSTGPLAAIRSLLSGFDTIPFFYDANVKLDWTPSPQDTVSAFSILSKDALTLNAERFPDPEGGSNVFSVSLDTASLWDTEGLVWRHRGKALRNTATAFRYFASNSTTLQGIDFGTSWLEKYSVVDDGALALGKSAALGFGVEYSYEANPLTAASFIPSTNTNTNSFTGAAARFQDFLNPKVVTNRLSSTRHVAAAYLEGDFTLGPVEITPGLRATYNSVNPRFDLDPRLALTLRPSRFVDVFAKVGKYSQLPSLESVATNYGDTNLTSGWALHYDAGVRVAAGPWEAKVEAYYKDLRDQILPNPSWDFFFPSEASNPRFLGTGLGRAYGLEVLLRRQMAKGFFGWVSYSLSRSERFDYATAPNSYTSTNLLVNNGMDYTNLARAWRPYSQDVTHNLILIASYDIVPKRFKAGVRMNLSSGKPYTDRIVTKNSNTGALSIQNSDDPLAARYPTQFTLDVRFDYTWHLPHQIDLSVYLDIWNVQFAFGHTNVSSYRYASTGLTEDMVGKPAPRTPVGGLPILPLLGLNVSF